MDARTSEKESKATQALELLENFAAFQNTVQEDLNETNARIEEGKRLLKEGPETDKATRQDAQLKVELLEEKADRLWAELIVFGFLAKYFGMFGLIARRLDRKMSKRSASAIISQMMLNDFDELTFTVDREVRFPCYRSVDGVSEFCINRRGNVTLRKVT